MSRLGTPPSQPSSRERHSLELVALGELPPVLGVGDVALHQSLDVVDVDAVAGEDAVQLVDQLGQAGHLRRRLELLDVLHGAARGPRGGTLGGGTEDGGRTRSVLLHSGVGGGRTE